ncbi:HPP family protein [Rubellimicrobium aerolatum]|uniref:HPP family protein n=1 Tax=Rubellimicrobium aerolatum TaxID=490979 RepID=A0ABW0SAV9_9RHOB|nr:HPP family protein [Rubellimicrobium aerolatum]MBP1806114.1 CBS-domain-containing membrane protein [Rubellimicrobium aerolatum]
MPLPAKRRKVRLRRALRALGPAMPRPSGGEPFRAALGAGLALLACGAMVALGGRAGASEGLILIAPLGATAFLLFAAPNSPLAQPWSAVVGNTVSAFVAVTVVLIGPPQAIAAGLAVFWAIAGMAAVRAMHPPGGAVALATVLAAPTVTELGYRFVLAPVLLDTVALVGLAMLFNRLTGRHYPFRQPHRDPAHRLGLQPEDLSALLHRLNQSANIGTEDFGRLLEAAEAESERRRRGPTPSVAR